MSRPCAINATFLHQPATGVGSYSGEVVLRLLRREGYFAYTSSESLRGEIPGRVRGVYPRVSPEFGARGHVRRSWWTQSTLRRLILRDGAALLYSPVPEAVLLPPIPQVVTVHDLIPLLYPLVYPRLQFYYRHVLPRMLEAARVVIADSETTRRDLVRRYGLSSRRTIVVPPGIDAERYRPQVPGRSRYASLKYLLAVGDHRPHKNLHRALEAFDRLADENLWLVLAGRTFSQDPGYVSRALARLRRPERVILPGYVPIEEMPALYSDAVALVLPSLYEGFGLTPLEAMACGTPVIASRAASIPEVCGDAAEYVDPLDVDDLERGMRRVLGEADLRRELRDRGLRRVLQYSWDRTADRIHEILQGSLS